MPHLLRFGRLHIKVLNHVHCRSLISSDALNDIAEEREVQNVIGGSTMHVYVYICLCHVKVHKPASGARVKGLPRKDREMNERVRLS